MGRRGRWKYVLALCGLLGAFPAEASDANADATLSAYIRSSLSSFETSERVVRTKAALATLQAVGEEAAIESPYSITATASQNLNQLPEEPEGAVRSSTAAGGSLRMRRRNGWQAGVAASVDYNRIRSAGNFYPYLVSVDVAYDLTQGGAEGVAKTAEKIAVTSARQRRREAEQALIDLRVEYIGLLVNLYGANCTLLQQRESRDRVAKTIEVATVMRKTKTMSNKDFLNFVQVQNAFERDIASSESLVQVLQAQVRRWGDAAFAHAKRTLAGIQSCKSEVDASVARAKALALSKEQIAAIAQAQPGAAAARDAVTGAELALRLEKVDRKPSISPFVQLDVGQRGLVRDDLVSLFVGLRMDWQPRTARRGAAQRVRELGISEARNSRDLLLLDNRARLHTLWVDIKTQVQVIESLQASLKTSSELIATLDTERSVGLVDSLSYNNALLNLNATRLQLLSSWTALERSLLELEIYLGLVLDNG